MQTIAHMSTIDQLRLAIIKALRELGETFREETGQHPSLILQLSLTDWYQQIESCFIEDKDNPVLTDSAMSFDDCDLNVSRFRLDLSFSVATNPTLVPLFIKETMDWLR